MLTWQRLESSYARFITRSLRASRIISRSFHLSHERHGQVPSRVWSLDLGQSYFKTFLQALQLTRCETLRALQTFGGVRIPGLQ